MNIGKRIGSTLYVHRTAIDCLAERPANLLNQALEMLDESTAASFNVVKIDTQASKVAFLDYQNFYSDPFPPLNLAISVDVLGKVERSRDYRKSNNPPILHRKELLLPLSHPSRQSFDRLTSELEELGLYREPHKIGHLKQWANRLVQANIGVCDNRVVELSSSAELSSEKPW